VHRFLRPLVGISVAAMAATAAAGCAAGGAGPSAGSDAVSVPSNVFVLSSPAFAAGLPIPARFTCDGANVSPALAWSGVPVGTAAFVLLVDDPDAGGFVHWLVGPMGPTTTSLAEAMTASDPPQGVNGFGKAGWGGPCPPSGTHHYRFRLAAIPAGVAIPSPLTGAAARDLLGRALGVAVLTGTYARQ
jgi:Raf kinase inhibitor-like YbhB/YbcL family protein